MRGNVPYFVSLRLAKDEEGTSVPDEPHGSGLRGYISADGRKPNHVLLTQVLLDLAADLEERSIIAFGPAAECWFASRR